MKFVINYFRKSLRRKLVLASVVIEVVMLSVLVWNSIRISEYHLYNQTENRINELLPLLNASISGPLLDYDIASLNELLAQIIQQNGVSYIELNSGSDRPVISYGAEDIPDVINRLDNHHMELKKGSLGNILEIITPVSVASRSIGTMRVQINTSFIVMSVYAMRGQGAVIAVVEIVLSIILLTLVGLALTRHLWVLTTATRKVAEGDFSARIPEDMHDEIGEAAHAFNTMSHARMLVESALKSLARSSSIDTNNFFEDAVKILGKTFRARYVFIGLLDQDTPGYVCTEKVCKDGKIVDNFTYNLKYTPCENVLSNCSKQLIPSRVHEKYPKDELLISMGLESYFGAPLVSSQGQSLGLVVVTHTDELEIEPWMDLLLEVFAARISMELERSQAEKILRESDRYNRMLFEESSIGLALCHMDGTLVDCNPAYAQIIDREIEEIKTLSYWDITPEKYKEEEQQQLQQLEHHGHYGPYEKEYIHRDGHLVPVQLSGRILNKDGVPYIWSSVEDISERKLAERALSESESKLQAILDNAPALISIKDREGRITMVNRRFNVLAGASPLDYIGKGVSDLYSNENAIAQWRKDLETIDLKGSVESEELVEHKDGAMHTYLTVKFPVIDASEDKLFGICAISTDITERKQAEETIHFMAFRDSLTGLYNRNEFEKRLTHALENAHEHNSEHVVLYLDLDQFKVINDTCGHGAGDEMLRQLAGLLKITVRDRDTIARLGGDEFGLLMESCPLARAEDVADMLIDIISNFRFVWEGKTFAVGVSIGIAQLTLQTQSVSEILKAADMACYAAKDAGRNRYQVYHLDDQNMSQRESEMHWVSEIREALDNNNFVLFRQPIISLNENESNIQIYEYLVRMHSQDGKTILPDTFIVAAERYNLMPALDRWVIRAVLEHAATSENTSDSSIPDMFINLSGTSLNDSGLSDYIRLQLRTYRVDPRRLCFEITETAAIANLGRATEFIQVLRDLGCCIALDDFGSGLSSFSYLKTLPVNYLKIDGSFVKQMLYDPMNIAIVEAIYKLAHAAGIRTIAEFVEDQDTMERLKEIGIDFAQGYAIAHPEPVEEISKLQNMVVMKTPSQG